MSVERRSLQDLIRARQQGGFVGRQGQLSQYQENLALPVDSEHRRFIFNIYGDAGVGKTYLTKQLRQKANDSGGLTAYTDETADDPLSVMTAVAEEFARQGAQLGDFEKRVTAYRQRRHELESDPQAPDDIATFLTKAAVTVTLAAARDVPIAGSLLSPIDAAAVADQANRARTYLTHKFSDRADVRLLLSPAEELTPVFVAGLNRVAANRLVAMFFDTYERTAPLLDSWLRDFYAGKHGSLPAALITTISGQYPLNPNIWGDYLSVIADISLEPFSDAEARQFLASKNITDEQVIDVIVDLSGRLPMWLATLAEARQAGAAEIGDPTGDAVGRFLKWEDDPLRRTIAISGALPRTFNQDVLDVIAPVDKKRELFDWLCGRPFVDQQKGSWKYHEVARLAMLRLQRAQSPNEWRNNHLALAQAYAQWATEAISGADDTWENRSWVDNTRESTYHLLCADPVNNLPLGLTTAVSAARRSIVRAEQWAILFADAARDSDHPILGQWAHRLRVDIHDGGVTQYLTYLINDAKLDKITLATAFQARADAYRNTERYDEALADFGRAIELDPVNVRALRRRGQTYHSMTRYDEALADFGRAVELDPGNVSALIDRGMLYQIMRRYDEALADFDRAVELDSGNVWIFVGRGLVYDVMERYDEALADLSRAVELGSDIVWIFVARGNIYHSMTRYDEALADLDRAVELDSGNILALVARGGLYHSMTRYDEALADLDRAVELDPGNVRTLINRGLAYDVMERYGEALADLSRAVELDSSNARILINRGRIYHSMERYDEALADLSRAVELDSSNARILINRGRIYHSMERYDEALADLSRAVELDSSNARILINRGRIYHSMERYDEALADLSRAVELDPANTSSFTNRSQIYHSMERYDEALADLNRTIELDPANAWSLTNRGLIYVEMERNYDAFSDFSRAIELDPANAWAIRGRGLIYLTTQRYDEGSADLSRAIELDPSCRIGLASGLVSAATNYLNSGERAAAALMFKAIVLVSPNDELAHNNYAFCLLPVDPLAALGELEIANELSSGSLMLVANWVLALHLLGRTDEALALGNSENAQNLSSNSGLMWACQGDHTLLLEDFADLQEYLRSLLTHIKSESAGASN